MGLKVALGTYPVTHVAIIYLIVGIGRMLPHQKKKKKNHLRYVPKYKH